MSWGDMPSQPEQQITLGVRDAQRTDECLDDLDRGRGCPTLFQPGQVVDGDSGKPGELFATQSRGATAPSDRHTDGRGRDTVAPLAHPAAEFPRLHPSTVRDRGRRGKVLWWHWQSYDNQTTP
ncbi:hypothetical protein MSTO_09820 [Mycobacterium stomatepiae]|uniref:Uncharacterized protein n=1 Tax=Mycobacterium stomatepiae TaxID=470076 RepID=A0A7I7Q3Z6_9MYCO|nr:hypothetical protein MSTO_09820 [Mycobacterium stomatepiae]